VDDISESFRARQTRVQARDVTGATRGHFAAWEEPELFAAEIRAAFRPLR